MRFHAPARSAVDAALFAAPVFDDYRAWQAAWQGEDWPPLTRLNAWLAAVCAAQGVAEYCLVEQSPVLLADGLHFETRTQQQRAIACRRDNWHDLFNALVWLRHLPIKRALNARQAADVERYGPRQRSRGQCALTHFDEAGIVLVLRDARRLAAWDAHDWVGLFGGLAADEFAVAVIGHALLEHALEPERLLVGKAIAVLASRPSESLTVTLEALAQAIAAATCLNDPQELRPLPLMGLPGWHAQAGQAEFLRSAPCFQPRRAERQYPPPFAVAAVTAMLAAGEQGEAR